LSLSNDIIKAHGGDIKVETPSDQVIRAGLPADSYPVHTNIMRLNEHLFINPTARLRGVIYCIKINMNDVNYIDVNSMETRLFVIAREGTTAAISLLQSVRRLPHCVRNDKRSIGRDRLNLHYSGHKRITKRICVQGSCR
ncbi:MAG: hypothetical protein ACYCZO_14530, partial [Daejeonella sp.]